MRRLVCHIGTHKTGTSSFQRYCYKFRELLSEEGVCYPLIKGHENLNNHSVLAWALDKIDQESSSKMLNNVFSQFKDNKHHTLLISSEDLEKVEKKVKSLTRKVNELSKQLKAIDAA